MPAFYNGRQLGQGEFAVVLDGITYVGSATSFNVSRVATDSLARVELSGVVFDREGTVDAIGLRHLDSFLDRPAPAPVEPEVPQPQLRVQYVDYNNLPVRGEADCLYVIYPHDALGAGVELPCAYVYRPTAYDASPGMLNTLPYQPTNISARLLRASYAQGDRFPRPRRNGDGRFILHRVAGASPIWCTALLLSNEQVHVEPEMLCEVSGPTLAARWLPDPEQARDTDVHPTEAPAVDGALQLTVQIVPWSQLPIVGDRDTLYCVSVDAGGAVRDFEENAYVYRPFGSNDPRPYKATNVSATTVARVHRSGDRLHSVAAPVRDSSGVSVCYVTSESTVPYEVRTRTGVLAWIPAGWRAIGEIPTRGRPGHLVVPSASSISVPQVSPQTARDVMTSGWGTPIASTTLVEELPTDSSPAWWPTDVAAPEMAIVREQYPITFVPGAARELADRMMTEVNAAVASEAREHLATNSIAEYNTEADRQFTAAVDAVLNTQTDPEVVADLTAAMAEAPEPSEPRSRPITVRHVSHHDALPEVGDTEALYCVFGYPMALVYRVNEPDNFGGLLTAYFPTNVSASLLASMVLDGEAALCLRYDFLMSAGTQIVRFAYDPSETRATDFRMGRLYMLPDSTAIRDPVWTNGPWFHSRATPAPADHGPNRNGDVFTNAVNAVNDSIRAHMREDNFFRRVFPATPAAEVPDPNVVAYSMPQGFTVPQRRVTGDTHVVDLPIRTQPPTGFEVHLTIGEPAPAAPAAPPPAPSRRRLLLD